MLALTLTKYNAIQIGPDVLIVLSETSIKSALIAIDAPKSVTITVETYAGRKGK